MKKEFLFLSALISCTILFYAVLPNLNVSDNDQNIKTQNNKIKVVNNPNDFDANKINLTFDIVRLDPNGDVIIAGETLPNTEVNIYDGNERLASVFSDSSGDWVWISENPLGPGIKRVALKSFKDGKEFLSDQQIIILREKDNKKMSKIIRFTQNSNIEILNNDSETSSLYLDIVEFDENKSLTVTGRALPNSNIKVFLSENLKTENERIVNSLKESGCEVRGCSETMKLVENIIPASNDDWSTEYLEAIISIKMVNGIEEAIAHIRDYSTNHTDSIITENK